MSSKKPPDKFICVKCPLNHILKTEKIDDAFKNDYIKLNYPESDDECLVADPLADTDFRNKKLIKL